MNMNMVEDESNLGFIIYVVVFSKLDRRKDVRYLFQFVNLYRLCLFVFYVDLFSRNNKQGSIDRSIDSSVHIFYLINNSLTGDGIY